MISQAQDSQSSHERPIGIITLDENIPCPPGTPGNPSTFAHSVCYEIVRGSGVLEPDNPAGLQAFLAAGRSLVEKGVCAITGNCGLMIVYQEQLAAALPVPVFLSSLLQLPFIARMYGPQSAVGIIASSCRSLKAEHLRIASQGAPMRTVVADMEGKPHFFAAVSDHGKLDFNEVQSEVIAVAIELATQNQDLKAILFECVDLPPYATAVQKAVGLPVFDITTLIGYVYSALVRSPFSDIERLPRFQTADHAPLVADVVNS
jgi:hypothetical protein